MDITYCYRVRESFLKHNAKFALQTLRQVALVAKIWLRLVSRILIGVE